MLFTNAILTFRRGARRLFPVLGLLLAGGCADIALPDIVFDDGPTPGQAPAGALNSPEAVLTGQRPVRRADPGDEPRPTLASVPERPTAFSTPVERQKLLDRLRGEREAGAAVAQDLRSAGKTPASPGARAPEPVVPAGPPPVPEPVGR